MKVRDKRLKKDVDVCDKDCPRRSCYWPREDPGVFTQGVGYRTRTNSQGKREWLCGNREIRGCPQPKPEPNGDLSHADNALRQKETPMANEPTAQPPTPELVGVGSKELLAELCARCREESHGYQDRWLPTELNAFCEWWKREGQNLSPQTAWFMENQMIAAVAFEAGRKSANVQDQRRRRT